MNHREGMPTYAQLYAEFSKKVKRGMYGPRFTGGVYGVVNGGDLFVGPHAGAIVGYEQPIHPKISIVADSVQRQKFLRLLHAGTVDHASEEFCVQCRVQYRK